MARLASFSLILIVPVVAVFAVNLPHTFTNGTIADADEVNANFEALVNNQSNDSYKVSIATKTIPNTERYTALDYARLIDLCGDDDGCSMRLCSTNPPTGNVGTCRTGYLMFGGNPTFYTYIDYYDSSSGEAIAADGAGENEILIGFNCALTDADRYFIRSDDPFPDDGAGFGLKYNYIGSTFPDFCTTAFHD